MSARVPGRAPGRVSGRAPGRSAGRTAEAVVIPVAPPARGSRGGFGRTWWGQAWVDALEKRARLDPNRLPRGRTYARTGTVGDLVFVRGEVQAKVQGRRPSPYSVRVRVPLFTDSEWDRVLDTVASQLGHTAALLDGELPPEVADDVKTAGLDLLPGAGDVETSCSCPDWANPCKHAAAVCYLIATASDADPFVLLLLRGRGRDEVLAGLRARRRPEPAAGPGRPGARPGPGGGAGEAPGGAADDPGVDARAAFAAPSPSAPVPPPPLPPSHPGQPAAVALAAAPPGAGYPTRDDLLDLAADAASRAWELAAGVGDGGLGLSVDADLARRAARLLGTSAYPGLVARTGMNGRELARWALAWRYGGAGGLDALRDDGSWVAAAAASASGGDAASIGDVVPGRAESGRDRVPERTGRASGADTHSGGNAVPGWAGPGADDTDEDTDTEVGARRGAAPLPVGVAVAAALPLGKAALAERTGGRPRVTRNRVTSGSAQLRLGRDGRWYPYRKSGADWDPAGPPDSNPAVAASILPT